MSKPTVTYVDFNPGITERAVKEFFGFSSDFIMEGGEEFLYPEAKKLGYKTNAAYFADTCETVGELIEKFKKKEGRYFNLSLVQSPYYSILASTYKDS